MLYCLKDAKVHEIYRKTAEIIREHGFTHALPYDPYTKQVDFYGALLLACGASEKLLASGLEDAEDVHVPPINLGKVRVAYEYIEAVLGEDPSVWAETHTSEQAEKVLLRLADRIEISINLPELTSLQPHQKG